jgi:hypothetical protein
VSLCKNNNISQLDFSAHKFINFALDDLSRYSNIFISSKLFAYIAFRIHASEKSAEVKIINKNV